MIIHDLELASESPSELHFESVCLTATNASAACCLSVWRGMVGTKGATG